MAAPDGYVDINDAARIVGRHPVQVRAAAARGEIPDAFKFGGKKTGRWNFTETGLHQWMRGHHSSREEVTV